MLIVGELINSTRKAISQAMEQKDKAYLQELARRQVEAGAHILDINAATSSNEIENIQWLADIVQEVVDVPICIDSPSAEAVAAGLARCQRPGMVNSISAEQERWEQMLPLIQKYGAKVVALCMQDGGMPETVDDRLEVAEKLVSGLTRAGVAADDIYLDPLIKPLGVDHNFGLQALETTRLLREKYPQVHVISGLSNISFGLPERRVINRAFLVMSVAMGMDAFILDPLDQAMMSLLAASRALAGQDEYCMDYITAVRAGLVKA
ncbi:methyltetrahydrofolate cobalamin methyltransferase [Paradesulfitobacterium ferrireducens]|uniref:methyltetrahydrofolate cobalamin methyltransferase n=1 Tax=Paradesulfitobacterium ferrireducens TaxID=2816476 RepID=UPI001A8D432D|nr:dihydropteroate synthase [Paradesulfitobacterium ferrireducens]